MKKNYFNKLLKNRSFVKGMNIVLSAVLVTNMIGTSNYNAAIADHPERITVDRVGDIMKYTVSKTLGATTGVPLVYQAYVQSTREGRTAYCIDYWKLAANGDDFKRVRVKDDKGLQHIVYSNPGMKTEAENYYVRQMAISHYLGQITQFIEGLVSSGADYRDKAVALSKEAAKVKAGTVTSKNIVSNTFKVNPTTLKFNVEGDYYVTDWYTVTHTGELDDYSVSIENGPTGVQVLDKDGAVVSKGNKLPKTNDRFKLRVPLKNVQQAYNDISVNVDANFRLKQLVEYHPITTTDKGPQKVLVDTYVPVVINRSSKATIDQPKGSLKVIKTDEAGGLLQGAKFELSKNNVKVSEGVSNERGEIIFNDLIPGTYKLTETQAPSGYQVNTVISTNNIVITGNSQKEVTVNNLPIAGRISVVKKDAEKGDLRLEGAQFVIKNNNGAIVDTITTNKNGVATSKSLNQGVYTIEETKAPAGYKLGNYTKTVNVLDNGKTYNYDVTNNVIKGKISIEKVDATNQDKKLEGAVFDVIAVDVPGVTEGTVVAKSLTTGVNGVVTTGDLRYGTYKIVETKAPSGYQKVNTEYTVTIDTDAKVYTQKISNTPVKVEPPVVKISAKVKVVKLDAKTNAPMANVTFKVTDKATGEVKGNLVTGDSGQVISAFNLEEGEYQLTEVNTPSGYKAIAPINFTINAKTTFEDIDGSKVYTINVLNERLKGSLVITKVDAETKEALSGVEFLIEATNGLMKGETFTGTTNNQGKLTISNLEFGTYKVKEVRAREGYVLNTTPQTFNISKDGEKAELTFENQKEVVILNGSLKVVKTNENGLRLEGAKFDLLKDGAVVKTASTNTQGEIIFGDLTPGKYTLVEKEAPTGYIISTKAANGIEVTIEGGKQSVEEVVNKAIRGVITVTKKDSEKDDLKLQGAQFVIKNTEGAIVDTIVTDSKGVATSKVLGYGTYTITEMKAPEGYKLGNFTETVKLLDADKSYSYTVTNDVIKGKITIEKVDSKNANSLLPGAGFNVIAVNVPGVAPGTIVQENILTGEDGTVTTGDLRYGTYKIVEVTTPEGFWKSDKEYPVTINEDGKIYVQRITNDPIETGVKVVKTGSKDKNLLQGVKFKLVDKKTGEDVVFVDDKGNNVSEFVTDELGIIMMPSVLRVGTYELVEVEALEGYSIMNPIEFTITSQTPVLEVEGVGRVYVINAENDRIKSNLVLTKIDSETKEPLSDTEFEIESLKGFMVGEKFTGKTDENGKLVLKDLEYGKYKVTETKSKHGYVLNEEVKYFEITENGKNIELTFENKPVKGSVKLLKVDEDNKNVQLEGVEFTLYNEKGDVIETQKTNKEGKIEFTNLKLGKYKIVETKALEGYISQDEKYEFEISEDGQVHTLVVSNERIKGEVLFTKIDSTTKEVVAGAKMKIYGVDENNKHIEIEFESTAEGNTIKLPLGKYEVKEVEAPKGYVKSLLPQNFEVVEGKITKVEFENKKIPTIQDILKPSTGDTSLMSFVLVGISIAGLLIINKDKFKKDKKEKNDVDNSDK